MNTKLLVAVAAITLSAPAPAAAKDLWEPQRPDTYRLDHEAMKSALRGAPEEISLPAPDGRLHRFRVRQAPVMEPGLARKHPDIATYRGRGVDEPAASVRLDLGPLGFHASVRGPEGTWYVDPADGVYRTRYVHDAPGPGFVDEEDASHGEAPEPLAAGGPTTGPMRRIYRLALASDPGFANLNGGPANVTAAKVTLVSRLNQIFEDETSISLRLIADNDLLNLNTAEAMTGPDGPCGDDACYTEEQADACSGSTIDRNVSVFNEIVGSDSYDIGHIALFSSGGGIAGVGVVGGSGKARGCSSFVGTNPDGILTTRLFAHEMGHQFGARHSFNGRHGTCGDQRDAGNSVEPGSGSSLMAYPGNCELDDLQFGWDPYWSQRSFQQIVSFVTSSDERGGFVVESTGNSAPAATAPDAVTIPLRTPFALTGSASDADGDPITYLWEQNDRGGGSGTALRTDAKTNGPLFRQFGTVSLAARPNVPSSDPTRALPDMAQVLANRTNAETGSCLPDDVECFSEFLPTEDYVGLDGPTLHFRMTARDGRGGVSSADTAVHLAPDTGPFLVTAPNTAATLEGGSTQTIAWDVAGTDAAPIAAADVKISLSTDGGETFQHTLAASTPNDGSAEVELPEVATTRARIKVEAVGNVFFDVSGADFRIRTAPVITDVDDLEVQYSDAIPLPPITATDGDTPGSELTATATGLPAGISLVVDSTSDGPAPGTRTWRLAGTVEAASGVHHATITVTDHEGLQRTVAFDITVRPEDAQVTYVGDELATGSPAAVLLQATVRDDPDANRGDIRNATVTFREGARTLCAAVPVALLGSESTIGSARCSAALGVGAHAIDMTVDGSYTGAGQARVDVARPDGAGVSVAASQRIGTSAGVHPGDPGSLLNVAFSARTSLNGAAAIHIRSGGRIISVTSVDIQSAGFAGDVADVRARARLSSAMGPLVQDATLRVRATDRGFDDDSLSLTLWDGDRLLFASEWNGVQTVERPLHSGSVLVF